MSTIGCKAVPDAELAARQRARDIADSKSNPIRWWAGIGLLFTVFQLFVVGRWIASGPTRTSPPNPAEVEGLRTTLFHSLEVISPILTAICAWHFLLKPLIREKRLTHAGILVIMMPFMYFWDWSGMYLSPFAGYSSIFFNWGNWMGFFPGVVTPNVGVQPEPVLLMAPGYVWQIGIPILILVWAMRKCKQRYPNASVPQMLAAAFVFGFFYDFVYEVAFIKTQIWSYWGAIQDWSLWGGHWFQFPVYEIGIWAVTSGLFASVLYFTDDKGQTFVERGVERLRYSAKVKGLFRILALLGIYNVIYCGSYMLPMNLFAIHGDPPPADTPLHLINGICGPGTAYACTGPNVPLNRAGADVKVGPNFAIDTGR